MRPATGVRYEFERESLADDGAVYLVTVYTPEAEARARVAVSASGATVLGEPEGIAPEHLAQLVALAKTLGKKGDEGYPRRLLRWRSPGVR